MSGPGKYFAFAMSTAVVSSVLMIAAQAPPAGQRAGRGQAPVPAARGLEITGEVQNFVPVTDAMLRNPSPGDWLMIRRDYNATSYSPLKEVTPANVKGLQMVWKSPMNESGTSQPAPIVHNGVIYLT